jgi:hypothetical protein
MGENGICVSDTPARRAKPVGLARVELESVEGCLLKVAGADVIDGTPLLDIEPDNEFFAHLNQSLSYWMTTSLEQVKERCSESAAGKIDRRTTTGFTAICNSVINGMPDDLCRLCRSGLVASPTKHLAKHDATTLTSCFCFRQEFYL